jgi:hypothetical protein
MASDMITGSENTTMDKRAISINVQPVSMEINMNENESAANHFSGPQIFTSPLWKRASAPDTAKARADPASKPNEDI